MIKKALLATSSFLFCTLIFMSNKSGPATNGQGIKTGGPGSAGLTCAASGCHTSGIGTTTGGFEIRKKFNPDSGAIVNTYIPDSLYLVRLSGSHSILTKFGFQIQAIKINDSGDVGIFSALGPKMQVVTIGSRKILENTDTISKVGSNVNIVFTWKAPPKNSGQVRFYGILNAVNGDGTSSNDQPSSTISFAMAESLNIPYNTNSGNLKTYPNPAIDIFNIENKYAANGDYQLQVINNTGQVIIRETFTVQNNLLSHKVTTTNWASGLYIIQLSHNGKQQVTTVVKQ